MTARCDGCAVCAVKLSLLDRLHQLSARDEDEAVQQLATVSTAYSAPQGTSAAARYNVRSHPPMCCATRLYVYCVHS